MKKHEEYLNNPYKLEGIDERIFTTKDDEQLTVDPNTGEYFTVRKVSRNKTVMHDSLVYTKIFQSNVKRLMDLSPAAMKIILYAMAHVKPLSEVVMLHQPDVSLFCDISASTFYSCVYELLDNRVLCRRLGSSIEFWFDPNIFFNGNRVKFAR